MDEWPIRQLRFGIAVAARGGIIDKNLEDGDGFVAMIEEGKEVLFYVSCEQKYTERVVVQSLTSSMA